ncbi:diguanylate cyclase [Cribrihabitans neustonicus]|uniref:diguanylate cyclase n=1 Tax=Cribrihabitans neustonicus TaxID=1429085 RepID=UPI003B58BC0F
MQGTILLIGASGPSRIMLKAQLAAAYYDVVQADTAAAGLAEACRCRPDLVISALSLPDGSAVSVKRGLRHEEALADLPVIAVTCTPAPQARIAALAAGIDDVLLLPVDEGLLQARLRGLMRSASSSEELTLQRAASQDWLPPLPEGGPAAASRELTAPALTAVVTGSSVLAGDWKAALAEALPHSIRCHPFGDIQPLMDAPVPEVFVIGLDAATAAPGLRLLAELRARAATRRSVVIAVTAPEDAQTAAEALDRGAHDVLHAGFDAAELALRLSAQLTRKRHDDQLRDSLRNGLRAAVQDPMTGLYNRRYATPFLDRVASEAEASGSKFAVMLADLDHFKRINDLYGHPAGDAVLMETARRLGAELKAQDMLARIGGEEFMIILPGAAEAEASLAALALCNAINSTPFEVPGAEAPVEITISIGAVIGGGPKRQRPPAARLIEEADQALYDAKHAGRNQVTLNAAGPGCTAAA